MPVHSAALLAYRNPPPSGAPEVFLIHMGGPFWARKDAGAWSLPKGIHDPAVEAPAAAAAREFEEEVGVPWSAPLVPLGTFRASRKILSVHVGEAPADLRFVRSNEFEVEWPPGSGRLRRFPEADRGEWFSLEEARGKVVGSQVQVLDAFRRYWES